MAFDKLRKTNKKSVNNNYISQAVSDFLPDYDKGKFDWLKYKELIMILSQLIRLQKDKLVIANKIKVVIIESLNLNDRLDGRRDGEVLGCYLKLYGINYSYYIVFDSRELFFACFEAYQEAYENHHPLIIHFVAHGNENEVYLTSGEAIGWDDLARLLVPIQKETKNQLILGMSSCSGYYSHRMYFGGQISPFFAMIGSSEKIKWIDAVIGFGTFYRAFVRTLSLDESIKAMRFYSGEYSFNFVKSQWIRDLRIK